MSGRQSDGLTLRGTSLPEQKPSQYCQLSKCDSDGAPILEEVIRLAQKASEVGQQQCSPACMLHG